MLGLLLSTPAWAHDADVVYVLVTEGAAGAVHEVMTLTGGTLSQLAPIDADGDGALSQADLDARTAAINAGVWDQVPIDGCTRGDEQARLREGFVELTARFTCAPGPLSQDFRILRGLTSNYRVVLGRQADGELAGRAFAQGNVQRLDLRAPGPRPLPPPMLGFGAGAVSGLLWLDVTLVFVFCLLLAASLKAAAQRLGVFVLAHTAVALSGVQPPELAGALLVAAVGSGFVLHLLGRGVERWPLGALVLLGAAGAMRENLATMGLEFQAGRGAGLLVLAAGVAPIALFLARRQALQRKALLWVGCLALAALGFSLVQTVRAF